MSGEDDGPSNVQKLTETRRRKAKNTNKPAVFDGKARL